MDSHSRRRVLKSLAAAGTIGVAGCSDSGGTGNGNGNGNGGNGGNGGGNGGGGGGGGTERWPQFHYDAGRTGHAPDVTGPSDGSISEAWKFEKDDQSNLNSVVIGDGLVVTMTPSPEEITKGVIWAINEGSGTLAWKHKFDQLPDNKNFAIADGSVYVTDGRSVKALDPADGSEQWSSEVALAENFVYHNGTLYGMNNDPEGTVAVDASDGSEKWSVSAGDIGFNVVSDGTLVTMVGDQTTSEVAAFDTSSGDEQWRKSVVKDGLIQNSPAARDGILYVPTDTGVFKAVDMASGDEQWSVELFDGAGDSLKFIKRPTVTSDTVYVGGNEKTYALDTSDGSEKWSIDGAYSDLYHDGDKLLANSITNVVALDPADGSERWSKGGGSTDFDGFGAGVFANGAFYTGTNSTICLKLA